MTALLNGWNAIPRGLRVLLLALAVLLMLYGPYVIHPNAFLFAGGGDGLKNYYSAAYYVKYDSGAVLTGMNYPYGEVVTFADGQLGLTFILRWLQSQGLPINSHIIGILNLLMLLSLVAAQYFLYKILRHYGLPFGWAAAFGILIGLLTPQVERWTGHFGLGYILFIPLIWWLYIKGREAKKAKWLFPTIAILAVSYFSFLHPYYLALSIVFFMGIAFAEFFGSERWRIKFWRAFTWVMVAVVPLLIVQLIMAQIDQVVDRPKAVWGFHYYRTNLLSLFFFPNNEVFDALQFHGRSSESHEYIGLVNVIMLLFMAIMLVRAITLGKWHKLRTNLRPHSLNKALISGTLAVLFAMGVPFVFGLEWVTDWMYPLTQFRSVGRFAWLFYIVLSVFTVREIYKHYRVIRWRKMSSMAFGILMLAIFLWSTDAFIRNRQNFWRLNTDSDSWYAYDLGQSLEQYDPLSDQFQAIFPIPYFSVGNEMLGYVHSHQSAYNSFLLSYHEHIPILANHAARISRSQSLAELQLFSDVVIYRNLPRNLPNDKPLLLVAGHDYAIPWEARYLGQASLIKDFENVAFYSLPVSALMDSSNFYWERAKAKQNSMMHRGSFFADSTKPWVYYDGFEDDNTTQAMLGTGSFWARSGESVLCSITPTFDTLPMRVEISLWQKSYWRKAGFPELFVRRYDKSGKLIYEARYGPPSEGMDIYKDWIRFACSTDIEQPEERIEVVMKGSFQLADELLIRPKEAEVWTHVADSGLTINNYPIYPRP